MKRLLTMFAAVALLALSAGTALAWSPGVDAKCVDGVSVTTVTLHADAKHAQYRLDGGTWTDYKDGDQIKVEGSATLDQRQRNDSDQEWDKITTQVVAIDCETPPPTEEPTPPPTKEPTPPPTEEPTPTPQPAAPAIQVYCDGVSFGEVPEGWKLVIEPGDILVTSGFDAIALDPGTYTYQWRDADNKDIVSENGSGKFEIAGCPTPTPKPSVTPKPTSTPVPTEETTLPPTDTVSSTTGGGGGSTAPVLAFLAVLAAGSLLLTTKRSHR